MRQLTASLHASMSMFHPGPSDQVPAQYAKSYDIPIPVPSLAKDKRFRLCCDLEAVKPIKGIHAAEQEQLNWISFDGGYFEGCFGRGRIVCGLSSLRLAENYVIDAAQRRAGMEARTSRSSTRRRTQRRRLPPACRRAICCRPTTKSQFTSRSKREAGEPARRMCCKP